MQEKWHYNDYEIQEGLKPGSQTFRYFFEIFQNGGKKCNYCVWVSDDALDKLASSREFDAVVASQKEDWQAWVKEKIDAQDFRNRALKIDKQGRQEINLSEMSDHFSPD